MAYSFADIVKAKSATAKETTNQSKQRFYFLKLNGSKKFTRVTKSNYEYAKTLMKSWSCIHGYTDKNGVNHYSMFLQV
jgi:hypothetical protein